MNYQPMKVNLLTKIFVWSIALEPMLYFMVSDPNLIGIGLHFSRILQIVVVFGFITRILLGNNYSIIIPKSGSIFVSVIFYLVSILVASLLGFFVFNAYPLIYTLAVHKRPFIELIMVLYTFIYFVSFSVYFLKNEEAIRYFFKITLLLFLLSFIFGICDLILQHLLKSNGRFDLGYDLITRHLGDPTNVGKRFHGFFGEPRDAFGALMLWVGLIYLKDYWLEVKKNRLIQVTIIGIFGLASISVSAFLSVFYSALLVFYYYFPRVNFFEKIKIFIIFVLISLIMFGFSNVHRFTVYLDQMNVVTDFFLEDRKLYSNFEQQRVDIVPIKKRFDEIRESKFMPLIFGSGLGSSSFENNRYVPIVVGVSTWQPEVMNARSGGVRLFYEGGILGTFLFLYIFLSYLKKEKIKSKSIVISMLVLLACYFAQKSYVPFIFLGALVAVVNSKKKSNKILNE